MPPANADNKFADAPVTKSSEKVKEAAGPAPASALSSDAQPATANLPVELLDGMDGGSLDSDDGGDDDGDQGAGAPALPFGEMPDGGSLDESDDDESGSGSGEESDSSDEEGSSGSGSGSGSGSEEEEGGEFVPDGMMIVDDLD